MVKMLGKFLGIWSWGQGILWSILLSFRTLSSKPHLSTGHHFWHASNLQLQLSIISGPESKLLLWWDISISYFKSDLVIGHTCSLNNLEIHFRCFFSSEQDSKAAKKGVMNFFANHTGKFMVLNTGKPATYLKCAFSTHDKCINWDTYV